MPSFSSLSLESRGEGGGFFSLFLTAYFRTACNFGLKFEPCQQNVIRNILPYSSLKSEISLFEDCLVFLNFLLLFLVTFFPILLIMKLKQNIFC